MLEAISGGTPDHIPLSFMIFSALRERMSRGNHRVDRFDIEKAEVDLGLDAVIDLGSFSPRADEVGYSDAPGFPVRFPETVSTRQWADSQPGERYPVMHKEYRTKDGTLTISVDQSDDWPYGSVEAGDYSVPFMDDYLAPRSKKRLVGGEDDLPALRQLLAHPRSSDIASCRENWKEAKCFADENGLLVSGGRGVGGDALAWFCGLEEAVLMAIDRPDVFRELLGVAA